MNKEGFIVSINAGTYTIFNNEEYIDCKARGKFRIGKYYPKVGDNIIYDDSNNYILDIKDRINDLDRPPLANIDKICVVASLSNPYIQPSLINRYLILAELINLKPILILTKTDLVTKEEVKMMKDHYEELGYEVYTFSSKTLEGLEEISKICLSSKVVFTGQSGAGKSTLINALVPGSRQKTNDISKALGRGKHTTRLVSFLPYKNGFIADTPGFSSIVINSTPLELSQIFPGFDKYIGKCKYNDCTHIHEDGCKIKEDVEKGLFNKDHYDTYVELINSIKERKY